ncbi:MAG: alpha-galactosidase [Candidatus Nanopelagicales bacterium]
MPFSSVQVDGQVFGLHTAATSYVFAIDPLGLLRHLHWGRPLRDIAQIPVPALAEVSTNDPVTHLTPEEHPAHGGFRYTETALAVVLPEGSRELRFEVTGWVVDGAELVITQRDEFAGVELDLGYRVLPDLDLIERWAVVRNTGVAAITVESLASGQLHIPGTGLRFTNVHGHWNAEQQLFQQEVSYGKVVVEMRRGTSTHHHNPYLILDRRADEHHGEVWFAALNYGGNFKGVVEQTQYGSTLAQLGLNDYDFAVELAPGEELVAPTMVIGHSDTGFAAMSHRLHEYGRRLMRVPDLRPVLYNSWEAAAFAVNSADQIALARKAAEIGIELFVMDDGWFGQRSGIHDGLGDWYANPEKFPAGLGPLVDEVHGLGMKFGIWFEPESVNPPTRLYAEHPEWIYQVPGRPSELSREQYLLDLTRADVADYVFHAVDDLLSAHEIDYVKWDVNRPIAQAGTDRSVWKGHTDALYAILARLHAAHPEVLFEGCASGGGRIDFGTLRAFDDFWTSDNTDAYERLTIQRSYSFVYPIKAMRAWVTDVPNFMSARAIPLRFRFHSAMMGTLGVGTDLGEMTAEELVECAEHVAHYKRLREVIQNGRFYRLDVLSSNDYHAFQYTLGGRTVVFVFLPQTKIGFHGETPRVRLHDLDPDATYEVRVPLEQVERSKTQESMSAAADVEAPSEDGPIRHTGEYLTNHGLSIRLVGDYASTILEVDRT